MDLQLKDRIALVAGSSSGIGRAIAATLLVEGCRVCITGREESQLDSTAKALCAQFPERVMKFAGDLIQPAVIESALDSICNRWGDPDILIANLGSGKGKPGWQQEEDEWKRLFEINYFASVRLAQATIPRMRVHGGVILFIASITAIEATTAPLPYSAAKAALVNYSKNLSRIVSELKIRTNCIAPGNVLFRGGWWEAHLRDRREEVERYISNEVPQKRFRTAEEIATLAAYLVSPVSAFATGECYIIDGGQTSRI